MNAHVRTLGALLASAMLLSGCADAWVTPTDTSAGQLDVKVSVTETTSPTNTLVVVQFLVGGKSVRFANGEHVTCNGVDLTLNELVFGYAANMQEAGVGGTYNFVYTQGANTTPFSLAAAAKPQITNPASGANVVRGPNLTVNYVADAGDGVDAGGSDSASGLAQNIFQPDNGTYTGLNVSSFKAGAGTVSITRKFEIDVSGSGFKSLHDTYRVTGSVPVTWQ